MKSNDKQATAELLAALVEIAIAHGRRHYSESGEPMATTLAVLECLQREGLVTVEDPARYGSPPGGMDSKRSGRAADLVLTGLRQ